MPVITERTFIKVNNPRNLPNNSSSSSLTFMTYNIHKQSHPKSPPKTTRASHRIPLIIKEITKTFQPDVAVLQEVDMFEEHYRTAFEDAGYECLYELGEKAHGIYSIISFKKNIDLLFLRPIDHIQELQIHPKRIQDDKFRYMHPVH